LQKIVGTLLFSISLHTSRESPPMISLIIKISLNFLIFNWCCNKISPEPENIFTNEQNTLQTD
jgi:hypothetical protein